MVPLMSDSDMPRIGKVGARETKAPRDFEDNTNITASPQFRAQVVALWLKVAEEHSNIQKLRSCETWWETPRS